MEHEKQSFVSRYIFSFDHKMIGKQYFTLAMSMGFIGGILAVMFAGLTLEAAAAETRPVEPVEVTPPLCNRFQHNGKLACTNIVEVVVRIPDAASNPGLVRCVLYSEEQQVLGTGEAILRPPEGKLWVVLRARARFGVTTLHARTACTIQPPYWVRE